LYLKKEILQPISVKNFDQNSQLGVVNTCGWLAKPPGKDRRARQIQVQNLQIAMPKLPVIANPGRRFDRQPDMRIQAISKWSSDRTLSSTMAGTTGMATSLRAETMSPPAPQTQGGSLAAK
jgi:hypothetical protein